jgi:hypothetical protein
MNDFTKEELEYLRTVLTKRIMEECRPRIELDINSRIKSMINSYPKCDHRSGMNHYNEKGETVGYDSDIYRCRHCDILFRFLYENGICVGHEELE